MSNFYFFLCTFLNIRKLNKNISINLVLYVKSIPTLKANIISPP